MIAAKAPFGGDESELVVGEFGVKLRIEALQAFQNLQREGRALGFDLRAASSYRGFERQKNIWDQKARGERTLLDTVGQPLNAGQLTALERVHAIMRWSALPGASRHHWGTDLDIFDASALQPGQKLELTVAETEAGGVFAEMYSWLNEYLATNPSCGFYRPYDRDRGGVAVEPWHLSYFPLAQQFEQEFSLAALRGFLLQQEFELKTVVLEHLEALYTQYIVNCAGAPTAC